MSASLSMGLSCVAHTTILYNCSVPGLEVTTMQPSAFTCSFTAPLAAPLQHDAQQASLSKTARGLQATLTQDQFGKAVSDTTPLSSPSEACSP